MIDTTAIIGLDKKRMFQLLARLSAPDWMMKGYRNSRPMARFPRDQEVDGRRVSRYLIWDKRVSAMPIHGI